MFILRVISDRIEFMEYEKIVLKNGVRVILVEKPDFLSFTMLCLFGTGSRNENEKNAGVSHFLEHMMYKGAKKRKTPMEVAQFVDSMGAEHNAFTGKEYTGYYVKAAADKILPAIDFLADNVVGAMIPEEEVLKERGVIVEEIKMYEDIPSAKMEEEFEKIMFPGDVLGRPIAGEAKIIEKMTRDDIVAYKEKNYSADNCVISICGNFLDISKEKLIEELEKNFKLKSGMPRESMQSNLVNSVAVKTIKKPIEDRKSVV